MINIMTPESQPRACCFAPLEPLEPLTNPMLASFSCQSRGTRLG